MNIYEFGPIKLLVSAANWAVTHLSALLEPFAGAESAALAVIALTVLVRACLIPVGRSQVKATVTRQRLAPQLAEIQRKYAKKPEELQRRTMELYKAEKASPFAGCLPVLAQMPVLMAVYGLFVLQRIGGEPNELLGHTLWDVPLSSKFLPSLFAGDATLASTLLMLVIMVIIAACAATSRKLLMPPTPAPAAKPAPQPAGIAGEVRMPDLTGVTKVLSFMPFMTAVIATFVPLAAALYLMTTTAWTLGERLILNRIYGVKPGAQAEVSWQS